MVFEEFGISQYKHGTYFDTNWNFSFINFIFHQDLSFGDIALKICCSLVYALINYLIVYDIPISKL